MDPLLESALKSTAPAIAAGLLCASRGGARLIAIAAAVGLLVGHGLVNNWSALVAPGGTQWLCWGVVVAALLAVVESRHLVPARSAPLLAAMLAAVTSWLVLRRAGVGWSGGEAALRFGLGAAATMALVSGQRALLARPAPLLLPILATLCLSVDAALLALSGSALLGQLCGAVAAALGAGIGTALWRRPFAMAPSDGTWIGLAHAGFLLAGVHLASLATAHALLAAVATCAPLLLGNRLATAAPRRWAALAVVLTLVPALVALALVIQAQPAEGF